MKISQFTLTITPLPRQNSALRCEPRLRITSSQRRCQLSNRPRKTMVQTNRCARISALEILAHRFVWTIVFLGLLLSWQRRWDEVIRNLGSHRNALFCLGSGVMVSVNWLIFIWAVNVGRVLETSLGYFMTPLVNVLLGAVILRERLSAWQIASILIAATGVSVLAFGYGHFPSIAVGLCTSFGLYGLLRKQSGTAAIPGLFLETMFLLPLAVFYLALLASRNVLTFGASHLSLSIILM